MSGPRVLIVIPAWNEAGNLERVVGELRAIRPRDHVVVVDDGSTDDTAATARSLGCGILELALHLGYGAAVQTGIKYGLRERYPVVVTFDGDGQHDPAEVAPLVAAIADGADLAIGSRLLSEDSYHGGMARRVGRRLFSTLTRAFTGLPLTDPTSGLKALGPRAQALFALAGFPDRFPDADALVLARRARLVVVERPSRMRPSNNSHSMHSGYRAVGYTLNMLMSLLVAAMGRDSDLHG
jgi:glycosyltransferase involved in cell wall biosynthesis